MRWLWRLTKVSAVLVVVLLILVGTGLSDTLVFYARVAKLYTQAPDTKIAMPLEDVSKKEVANTWGAPRGTGRRHEGQDIFAPKGTPILSATNGYIYKIGENNLGGQTVSVISSGGRVYYYAHLDRYAQGIEVGDRVSGQAGDRGLAADDLTPQRVVREDGLGEGDVDAVVGRVEAGGQLVEDDPPGLIVQRVEDGSHGPMIGK